MSQYANISINPDTVNKPSLPFVVSAGKYVLLFIENNPVFLNFTYPVAYKAGDTVPSVGGLSYIVKEYDLP